MKIQDIPWPDWMLRYVGTDAPEAFEDLIWSVGGSPPYGGVSWDEAAEVYNLLEKYRGPGQAPQTAYKAVLKFAGNRPKARDSLEIFRCYDQVTSFPDSYPNQPVDLGLELSRKLNHPGALATFLAFQSQLESRNGDLQAARELTISSLKLYLELAEKDKVYEHRISQNATNAVSLTAIAGDVDEAKRLFTQLRDFIDDNYAEQLRQSLSL